jgi:hypothetical protein
MATRGWLPIPTKPPVCNGMIGDALRVGARVLAAYWNEKREFEGFFARHPRLRHAQRSRVEPRKGSWCCTRTTRERDYDDG